MNNYKSDASEREKRFWNGESTLEEERLLKSESEYPYFDAMKQSASDSMNWDFQDFIQKTASATEEKKVVSIHSRFPVWLRIAAAVLLACFVMKEFYPNKNEKQLTGANSRNPTATNIPPVNTSKNAKTSVLNLKNEWAATRQTTSQTNKSASAEAVSNTLRIRHRKTINPVPVTAVIPKADTLNIYEPQFVLINGKPVYSENEAIKLTKQSLALLTDNISNGARHLSVVKELSIHF